MSPSIQFVAYSLLQRSILRLGILLLLFDVYLTWARIERSPSISATFLSQAPILIQYLFFLSLNALATLAHHLTVRLLATILAPKLHPVAGSHHANGSINEPPRSDPTTPIFPSFPTTQQQSNPSKISGHNNEMYPGTPQIQPSIPRPPPLRRTSTAPVQTIRPLPPPAPASPTAISTALLVSSCAKLFPILLVIWGPDGSTGGIASTDAYSPGSAETNSPAQTLLLQHALHGVTSAATPSAMPSASAGGKAPTSILESLAACLAASAPATGYLAELFGLLGSLLSLSAVDTHLVLLSNIEALYILLGCGYLRAVALAIGGQVARWAVQRVVLGAVGLVG